MTIANNAAPSMSAASHAVHRLTGEAADTDSRSDYRDTGADAGTKLRPRGGVVLVERADCFLDQHFVNLVQ